MGKPSNELAELKKENARLTAENEGLTAANVSLSGQLDTALDDLTDTQVSLTECQVAKARCEDSLEDCLHPPTEPAPCVYGEWTPTSEWSTCVNGSQSRSERRLLLSGGDQCAPVETRTATRACTMPIPPAGGQFAFTTIPGTELQPVLPVGPTSQYGHPGSHISAWNTMVLASDTDGTPMILYPPNGGDGDYFYPTVVSQRVEPGAKPINRTKEYPPFTTTKKDFGTLSDGSIVPYSIHSYGGAAWLPHLRKMWFAGGKIWMNGSTRMAWMYDVATNEYERMPDLPVDEPAGIVAQYDALKERVVFTAPGGTLWEFKYETKSYTKLADGPLIWDHHNSVLRGRELWIIDTWNFTAFHMAVWNIDTGQCRTVLIDGFVNMWKPGLEYDWKLDKLILCDGSLQIIDPVTLKAEIHSDPSWPKAVQGVNGTFGRFRRLPGADSRFAWVRAYDAPVDILTIGTPLEPQPIPPTSDDIVNIGSGKDFPVWPHAQTLWQMPWRNPNGGGDWKDRDLKPHGPNAWATIHHADYLAVGQAAVVEADVTALVKHLIDHPDLEPSFLITGDDGLIRIGMTEGGTPPELAITDAGGLFIRKPVLDGALNKTTGPYHGSVNVEMSADSRPVLKWDLSSIDGLTKATLRLTIVQTYVLPINLKVQMIDMPPINEPVGTIERGIADTVAHDNDLATHPDVILHVPLTSEQAFRDSSSLPHAAYYGTNPAYNGKRNEFGTWPNGVPYGSCFYGPNESVAKGLWWTSMPAGKPWPQFPPDQPKFKRLHFRYLMKIGLDVRSGMDPNQGMKFPGMDGSYEPGWGGVDVWLAGKGLPSNYLFRYGWSARLGCTAQSLANPGAYQPWIYFYGPGSLVGIGDVTPLRWKRRMLDDYVMCLELMVEINDFDGDTPVPNGKLHQWLDGERVYEDNAKIVSGHPWVSFLSVPYFNVFHGGQSAPVGPGHFEIGGCYLSTKYIGPPK